MGIRTVGLRKVGIQNPISGIQSSAVIPVVPNFVSAVVANATPTRIFITYDTALNETPPDVSAFLAESHVVTDVSISGVGVTLTVDTPFTYGESVVLTYVKPALNPLQSLSGGEALAFSEAITNNVALPIPVLVSAEILNEVPQYLFVTFDLGLNNESVPANSAFTVLINSVGKEVTIDAFGYTEDESIFPVVILKQVDETPFSYGDTVTVSYTKPLVNPLKGLAGGEVESFSEAVVNNIAWPALAPAGLTLTVDSDTQITANWTNNDTQGDGTKLEISTDNFATSPTVIDNALGVTSEVITGLTAGTLYYARIRAYLGGSYSAYSNVANAYALHSLINEALTGRMSLKSNGSTDHVDVGYTFPAFNDNDTIEVELYGTNLWPTIDVKFIAGSTYNYAPARRLINFLRSTDLYAQIASNNSTININTTGVSAITHSIKLDYNKTTTGKATLFVDGTKINDVALTNNALSTFTNIPDVCLYGQKYDFSTPIHPQFPSVVEISQFILKINGTIVVNQTVNAAGYFTDAIRGVAKYNRAEGSNTYPLTLIDTSSWSVLWSNNFVKDVGNTISMSGTGSYKNCFEFTKISTLDRITCSATVKFNDLASVFGIYRNGGLSGTFAKIDLAQNKLILCEMWNGTSVPVDRYTQTITQTINSSDTYTVSLKKNDGWNWIILTNNTTGEIDTLYHDGGLDTTVIMVGNQWGKFGITHLAGNITVSNAKIETDFPDAPKYAIYGDSFVEGNSLIGLGNDYDDRWCAKLRTHFLNNVLISGMGGLNSAQLLTHLDFDLDYFSPENVIVLIGLNDSVYAGWKTNFDAIIARVLANGATPILCTLTPRADRQTFLNAANDYILNTLSLSYQVLDFAQVLTVGGDRITQNASLFMADAVHPNIAGHEALYQYCLTELT